MLTDDEKRELIAAAIAKSDDVNHEELCSCGHWPDWCSTYDTQRPWSHDAEFVAAEALSLADALEGALTEPEWEHRWVRDEGRGFREVGYIKTESGGRRYVTQNGGALERRIAAGPWEEVTDV